MILRATLFHVLQPLGRIAGAGGGASEYTTTYNLDGQAVLRSNNLVLRLSLSRVVQQAIDGTSDGLTHETVTPP